MLESSGAREARSPRQYLKGVRLFGKLTESADSSTVLHQKAPAVLAAAEFPLTKHTRVVVDLSRCEHQRVAYDCQRDSPLLVWKLVFRLGLLSKPSSAGAESSISLGSVVCWTFAEAKINFPPRSVSICLLCMWLAESAVASGM